MPTPNKRVIRAEISTFQGNMEKNERRRIGKLFLPQRQFFPFFVKRGVVSKEKIE